MHQRKQILDEVHKRYYYRDIYRSSKHRSGVGLQSGSLSIFLTLIARTPLAKINFGNENNFLANSG